MSLRALCQDFAQGVAQCKTHGVGHAVGHAHGVVELDGGTGHGFEGLQSGVAALQGVGVKQGSAVHAYRFEGQAQQGGEVVGVGLQEVQPVGPLGGDIIKKMQGVGELGEVRAVLFVALDVDAHAAAVLRAGQGCVAQVHQPVDCMSDLAVFYFLAGEYQWPGGIVGGTGEFPEGGVRCRLLRPAWGRCTGACAKLLVQPVGQVVRGWVGALQGGSVHTHQSTTAWRLRKT
jgi:hypothetical protein